MKFCPATEPSFIMYCCLSIRSECLLRSIMPIRVRGTPVLEEPGFYWVLERLAVGRRDLHHSLFRWEQACVFLRVLASLCRCTTAPRKRHSSHPGRSVPISRV